VCGAPMGDGVRYAARRAGVMMIASNSIGVEGLRPRLSPALPTRPIDRNPVVAAQSPRPRAPV
jgi:hypothetical protein